MDLTEEQQLELALNLSLECQKKQSEELELELALKLSLEYEKKELSEKEQLDLALKLSLNEKKLDFTILNQINLIKKQKQFSVARKDIQLYAKRGYVDEGDYEVYDVPGDGACFFYSVLLSLGKETTSNKIETIRRNVAKRARDIFNKEKTLRYNIETFEEVFKLENPPNNGAYTWNENEFSIQLTAIELNVCIIDIESDGKHHIYNEGPRKTCFVKRGSKHFKAAWRKDL